MMHEAKVLVSRFRRGWARNKDIAGARVSHFYCREELSIARALCSRSLSAKGGRLYEPGDDPIFCLICQDILANGGSISLEA